MPAFLLSQLLHRIAVASRSERGPDRLGPTNAPPAGGPTSGAARMLEAGGLLSFERSDEYVLRLTFDRAISGQTADLRAVLPIVLEW
jgi:hypothetical protein